MILLNEFIEPKGYQKKFVNKIIDITVMSFTGDGMQTQFSVGESIGILFNVSVNGLLQERDVEYFHVSTTSKVTFSEAPSEGSSITITYYKGRNNIIVDTYGKTMQVSTEYYTYNGGSVSFTLLNSIDAIVTLDINGLVEEEGSGFDITGSNVVTLLGEPVIGSVIGITYLH